MFGERSDVPERVDLVVLRVLLDVELAVAGGQMLLVRRASWMIVLTSAAVTAAFAAAEGCRRGGGGAGEVVGYGSETSVAEGSERKALISSLMICCT